MTKEQAIDRWNLIDDDMSVFFRRRLNNPTGENALHYAVVLHIRKRYSNVILTSGLGENQITHYTRLDSWNKGYERGTPDIELKCKLGEYTDVVAIELKNPDKSNKLSDDQEKYLEKLEKINVKTFVSDDYDDIVDWLRDHYQELSNKPKSS